MRAVAHTLARRPHLTWRLTHPCAAYTDFEVWDTAELVALQAQLVEERARLQAVHAAAKEEKRKVIWKNAELDLIKLIKLEGWIETVKKDDRRTW